MRVIALSGIVWTLMADALWAHASEQGFVLLLPTDVYIFAGGATVTLTVLLLAILPGGLAAALFRPLRLGRARPRLRHGASLLTALLLVWLIWRGLAGPRDPAVNPLPLAVWVVFWVGVVSVQGLLGDLWRWLNPWVGVGALLYRLTGQRALLRYPRGLGHWPGVLGFLAFAGFLMADPAPTDPARLALVVGLYGAAMLAGLVLFGPAWLVRAEALTVLMRAYARMGLIGRARGGLALGVPGWQVLASPKARLGFAVFILVMLGSGSFDGLNETFWWLGVLGLNPLEFPGRSAVVSQNLLGLLAANAVLMMAFATCLWLGERLAGGRARLPGLFCLYAPTILPIALAYHIAHYLTSFLVDGQYVLAALSDALGLGHIHVTTGFLNTPGPVRLIWFTQAGVVVAGHVIAILLAHTFAMGRGQGTRHAVLGQAPLALFMVAYTVFGLWLLASPRAA
ncbi:MAG: hypothetical protein COW54_08415 [Rhodobacteraceae bacterium CG17_big_fil_post_rev_8_21_14_2_50_63_15]|nr:hypothetical protein [Roseovarius sp.]PIV78628.1 MAG: hypothetical protein COW54_08415 [Rhodobacteraceae bacterium CG17_big_fil_post_rev_8_21_14_2_50_63_15]